MSLVTLYFQEQIAERELLAGNIINKGKKDGKNFETESKTSQSIKSENESFEDYSAQHQQQHQKPKYETQDSFEQGKIGIWLYRWSQLAIEFEIFFLL